MDLLTEARSFLKDVEQRSDVDNDLLKQFNTMFKRLKAGVEDDTNKDFDYRRNLSNVATDLNRNRIRIFGK